MTKEKAGQAQTVNEPIVSLTETEINAIAKLPSRLQIVFYENIDNKVYIDKLRTWKESAEVSGVRKTFITLIMDVLHKKGVDILEDEKEDLILLYQLLEEIE
jgi:hypothetical protein